MSKKTKIDLEAVYPLSPMQQGMLFHSLYDTEDSVYFEQFSCTLVGKLNEQAFVNACQQVLDRHSVLRSAFVWKKLDKMLQAVHGSVPLPIQKLDLSQVPSAEHASHIQEFLRQDREAGFNLSKAPLLRLALIKLDENRTRFIWSHHHGILDGWSMPLIFREVFTIYEALNRGFNIQLDSPRPYRDYIVWIQRQDAAKAEAFWRKTLKGLSSPTPLVVERTRRLATQQEEEYHKEELRMSEETTAALQTLAQKNHVTINTLLQGAWALLLHRYSSEKDVVFGSTVSGRPADLAGSENMVGLFINTLPIRINIQPEQPVVEWLRQIQLLAAEMRDYEYSSLIDIQGWSDVPRNLPLFKSILVFENYPVDESINDQLGTLSVTDFHSREKTNYPITLVSGPGKQLPLIIAYSTTYFERDTIQRMLRHLENILTSFCAQPQQKVSNVNMLTADEHTVLVDEWSKGPEQLVRQGCVHEWFEQMAAKDPNALAVIAQDRALTYGDLNRLANRLSYGLRNLGVGPEIRVGICLNRSAAVIISMLAVMKAGGAFVPMDPNYPQERLNYMISDSQVSVIITQDIHLDHFSAPHAKIICLDQDWEAIASDREENPSLKTTPQNLAYMIYTSGSTGQPKGVLLQHRGLVNFIQAEQVFYHLCCEYRTLQSASISFDASVAEIFRTLLTGATLCIIDQETLTSEHAFLEYMRRQQITLVTLPPSFLLSVINEDLPALKVVISAGEACSWDIYEKWGKDHELINGYGPTEASVGTCMKTVHSQDVDTNTIPIGKAIHNAEIFILDERLQPVPIGVPGELHIGGAGLARGYHNRPDLTAAKFIPHPFGTQPGARLYKTGDLARFLPNGEVEFLGRVDFQVKIRGFRIELGEIEAKVRSLPKIRDAVVIARADMRDQKTLVAYVVAEKDQELDASVMKDLLRQRLPDYMVPSYIVMMEKLPLTPNGKVDRKALPRPDQSMSTSELVAPQTATEELLATIWESILKVDQVGRRNNFFEQGGHSLLATQLASRIRDAFGVDLPLATIFSNPTVSELAQQIDILRFGKKETVQDTIPLAPRHEDLPISFAQQRLWFLDQLSPNNSSYNISTAFRLTGTLNIDALQQALHEIHRRHEILRTTFAGKNGKPIQIISPEVKLSLDLVDLTSEGPDSHERIKSLADQEAQRPFNLEKGPLSRILLLRLEADEHIVLFTVHHIIADGWSVGILIQEFTQLYTSFCTAKPTSLADLPIQYADFAHWQRHYLQDNVLEQQLGYWKEKLADAAPVLELPTDRVRPTMQTFNGAVHNFQLSKELTLSAKTLSRKEGVTLFMVLLAAFQTLLRRYSGQTDILVGSPVANRTRSELEKLIGFFVNTLVFRSDFSDDPTFKELLRQVRKTSLDAFANQDLPFEVLVETLNPVREMSHSPLFQVAFVLQNAPIQEFKLPDLTLAPIPLSQTTSKYDITLTMYENQDVLEGQFEYNTDLFDHERIERMQRHFENLLNEALATPERKVSRLQWLTSDEMQLMTMSWNETGADYPGICVHEWFQARVKQHPDALALTFTPISGASESYLTRTYEQLNRQANQLARHLRMLKVGPEVLVGICASRSLDLIVGILGILKAGGAFLPLDPTYPTDRLNYMVEDSAIDVLLCHSHLQHKITGYRGQMVLLDSEWESISTAEESDFESGATPQNLAYCIYTSGSTGRPKGTLLQHQGLCNLATAQIKAFHVQRGSKVMQFSALSFDASVWETVMALLSGATLCLADQEVIASGLDLVKMLRKEGITTITLPPSVLSVLPQEELPELRTVITAGEACNSDLVQRWGQGRHYFNAYGPTETTVCASMHLCEPEHRHEPPIGKPINNTGIYIVDRQRQPVPIGVPGELVVGGDGLARGYLLRADLTAEKFIPDPFSGEMGARLYCTGDLAQFLPDGNIMFLGRMDHQVKMRGFRIELGEIETVLAQHPQVQDAIILAREDAPGDKKLVAYVVLAPNASVTQGDLTAFLGSHLPDYMVPRVFVTLEKMPLTVSGKVDRAALPVPDQSEVMAGREYVAPRNEIEAKLAEICAHLLNLERVGVMDNFFELGGHSLLATQFFSRIRDEFHVELPLRNLFEHPTVADLAALIVERQGQGEIGVGVPIEKVARGTESLDQLLASLEDMTDEEADELLKNVLKDEDNSVE